MLSILLSTHLNSHLHPLTVATKTQFITEFVICFFTMDVHIIITVADALVLVSSEALKVIESRDHHHINATKSPRVTTTMLEGCEVRLDELNCAASDHRRLALLTSRASAVTYVRLFRGTAQQPNFTNVPEIAGPERRKVASIRLAYCNSMSREAAKRWESVNWRASIRM
jgi:hypothetical protein